MVIKEILRRYYAITNDTDNSIWQKEFDYETGTLDGIFNCYLNDLNQYKDKVDPRTAIAEAILLDIQDIMPVPVEQQVILDFLRFQICTVMMTICAGSRLSTPLFHWISNSLSDNIDQLHERHLYHSRLHFFIQSTDTYIKKHLKTYFIFWSRFFFYYMRTGGGHRHLAEFYVTELFDQYLLTLLNPTFFYKDLDVTLGQIAAWASNNKLEVLKKTAVKGKLYLYGLLGYPEEWKKDIEFGLACCGFEYTERNQKEWAQLVLEKYDLLAHEELQILVQKYQDAEEIIQNKDQIWSAIDKYHSYLSSLKLQEKYISYELSRIFSLIGDFVTTLSAAGEIGFLNSLIGYFFKIDPADLIEPNNLVIQQNTAKGVQYSQQGRVVSTNKDPYQYTEGLTEVINGFLGTTTNLLDDYTFEAEVPIRGIGIPDFKYGSDLESKLVDCYGLDQPDVKQIITDASAYYLFSAYALPLQALFQKYVGKTLPIVQSFYKPLAERKINKILIWQGDIMLSEMECDAVERIFTQVGAEVKRHNWYTSSKEAFLEDYNNGDFDMYWLSCHGQFEHYLPHDSYLVLNDDNGNGIEKTVINYPEFNINIDQTSSRRLLVLNACDGATTTLNNSPSSIGFGSKMVNQYQSLISHQWPIYDCAGLIHGVLLASYLAEGKSYFESFSNTLACFVRGQEAVLKRIGDFLPDSDVMSTVKNNSVVKYNNVFYYGSLSYLE